MAKRSSWATGLVLAFLLLAAPAWASTKSDFIFFQGTQYPLPVVFIRGDAPGPTVMIQGGIQGDEPSGFLSAQMLAESHVLTGNLIVVPRANIPSILVHRREVNVDMNRRFDRDYNQFYEDRLARAVRFLLSRSSALIHLHEGSGFYDPNYVSPLRNPKRWGQSVIIDARTHENLDLASLVDSALAEINAQVSDRKYEFRLFNTRTFDPKSRYAAEMRKSLTFYALSNLNIPAMAVEVSKNIGALGWKVQHQVFAVTVLLRHLGVRVVPPKIDPQTVMRLYERTRRATVNGRPLGPAALALRPGGAINAGAAPLDAPDSHGQVVAVFATDRRGTNLVESPRLALEPFKALETRVDGRTVATTPVRFAGRKLAPPPGPPVFVCWLNGRAVLVKSGQSLRAVTGDQLILDGVLGGWTKEVLNFKGSARPGSKDGQDKGREIILDPSAFLSHYRLHSPVPGAARFEVVRSTRGARPARFYVDIVPRRVAAIELADASGRRFALPWASGGSAHLPAGVYAVVGADSNGLENRLLPVAGDRPLKPGDTFRVEPGRPMLFMLRQATTFAGLGAMTLVSGETDPARTALSPAPDGGGRIF